MGEQKKTVKQSNSYFPIPCLFTYFKNQHFKVGRNSWRVSLDLQVWHVWTRGDHGWTTSYSRGKMWSSDSVLQMLWSIHGLKILRLKAQNLGCQIRSMQLCDSLSVLVSPRNKMKKWGIACGCSSWGKGQVVRSQERLVRRSVSRIGPPGPSSTWGSRVPIPCAKSCAGAPCCGWTSTWSISVSTFAGTGW